MKKIHSTKRTYECYNSCQCIVYLNERVVENYIPIEEGVELEPITAYEYEGTEADGGTIINCSEITRDNLINGIIRTRYSQSEEDAIKTHRLQVVGAEISDEDKQIEYNNEWSEFNLFRDNTKLLVALWLN